MQIKILTNGPLQGRVFYDQAAKEILDRTKWQLFDGVYDLDYEAQEYRDSLQTGRYAYCNVY